MAGGVAVAFNSEELPRIERALFTAVIRRQIPAIAPSHLYFHVNRPISAIVARARVWSVRKVAPGEALSMSGQLNMTRAQIAAYIGERSSVGIYEITDIEPFAKRLHMEELRRAFIYHPPQNFLRLSEEAIAFILREGGVAQNRGP